MSSVSHFYYSMSNFINLNIKYSIYGVEELQVGEQPKLFKDTMVYEQLITSDVGS